MYNSIFRSSPSQQIFRVVQELDRSDTGLAATLTAMSDLEGNFDVIILGTGLVESIAAA